MALVPMGDEAMYSSTRARAAQAAAGEDEKHSITGAAAAQVLASDEAMYSSTEVGAAWAVTFEVDTNTITTHAQ